MSKTVSFVAKDELAEWLERTSDKRMKSVSAVCQDIIAKEYRRQRKKQRQKRNRRQKQKTDSGQDDPTPENSGQDDPTPEDSGQNEKVGEVTQVEFPDMTTANAFREEYPEFLYTATDDARRDDKRRKTVSVKADTPVKYLPDSGVTN